MRRIQGISVMSLILLLFVTTHAGGEEERAKTKLEELYYTTGSLIIIQSKEIGRIKNGYYYQTIGGKTEEVTTPNCWLNAVQVTDKTRGKKAFGVVIGIFIGGKIHQMFIDYDEIPSLVEGVEFLLNDAKKPEDQQVVGHIEYRSKGGLSISADSLAWGGSKQQELERLLQKLGESELLGIEFVSPVLMFEETSSIEKLKQLFVEAKEHLDAIK